MIQICRAEDGQLFQVNANLRDIERVGSLELFLHQEIGIDEDAALAFLSDGRRLMNSNLRELAGMQDQAIFVFNKYFVDYDVEEVLHELAVEPPLQPSIELENFSATPPVRPSQIASSYLKAARAHHDFVKETLVSLHHQHEAIRIASTSLEHHVLPIVDTFESLARNFREELERQAALLSGVDADLELVCRVQIHVEFLSTAMRKAIEAGDRPRTLGDYVSSPKMKQVADTCMRTHQDLQTRFLQVEEAVQKLSEGTDAIRTAIMYTGDLESAELSAHKSQEIFEKMTDSAASLDSPALNPDIILQELRHLDSLLRSELQMIYDTKNSYARHCITTIRHISTLNLDITQIPSALSNLQTSFRGKNSFTHIQRLHKMLYAYGATVIEIVRRKEFSRFFYQRAQNILEVMAKLSANERKRRQVYRGEVHGQLPFETRGMDDPVPTIDFSPTGSTDAPYSLERQDIDALINVLEDLEQYAHSSNDSAAFKSVQECRGLLEKLIVKMDSLESGFDKIAERSLLSASRISFSRRRTTEAEEELAEQLRVAQEEKSELEEKLRAERNSLQSEIMQLKSNVSGVGATASEERDRADRLERELHQLRAQLESEISARRIVEERNAELSADIEDQRRSLTRALADATDQAKVAEQLRQELSQARAEFEEVKELEYRNSRRVANLLEEQANNLRLLEEARARGEDLEIQIRAARSESSDVHHALQEASLEKDRLLRAQANEHDRIIRDHIAEADGDRAVLERQFHELQAVQQHTERKMKDLKVELEIANTDAMGLREELQRVEHELREARHVERLLRDDLNTGRVSQSGYEQRLEDSGRLIAQILDVAISFRNSHVKALLKAQEMAAHPGAASKPSHNNMAESVLSSGMHHSLIGHHDEPSPIDPSDPASALETLRAFDHDHFLEGISKTGLTIRKWQKQCKEYRERAKGKISFRNFTKGDLALFLPTRNSVSKPWAAFNVSFPHYFLQATGHLAEQLKTREWIVARITSITERVVDHQDPTSNPYGLGDGVKYYMLEVEDWTQPTHNKRRTSSRKVSVEKNATDSDQAMPVGMSPPDIPAGPPGPEVDEAFRITHPPSSHLFLSRTRANSSPTARPSSLSRLLAQAAPTSETAIQEQPTTEQPTAAQEPSYPVNEPPEQPQSTPEILNFPITEHIPPIKPSPPLPSPTLPAAPQQIPNVPSPLRPGSRASRLSTASKFSVGRIPTLGASPGMAKAAPTTALVAEPLLASPSSASPGDPNPFASPSTPSPEESISDAISNIFTHRRRTTSYHIPRPSPLTATTSASSQVTVGQPARPSLTATSTLANLASSWGVSFGRKKTDRGKLTPTVESPTDDMRASSGSGPSTPDPSAQDLLKRF
ncbi:putative peripheral membrane protein [Cyathus striatus]|nr:putative peripheral membrane protein [Cyathus striatus]